MSIFLSILKIIGIILLILFAFVLFLILLLLFVPIRYELDVSYDNKTKAIAKISWLLSFIRFRAIYDNALSYRFYIFFFPFNKKKADSDVKKQTDSVVKQEEKKNQEEKKLEDTEVQSPKSENNEKDIITEEAEIDAVNIEKKGIIQKLLDKLKSIKTKIIQFFSSFINKIMHMVKMKDHIARMLDDVRNKKAVEFLKKEAFRLLKRICPKKLKANVSYSTGSPDTTALIFGVLASFPIGYKNRWCIIPRFEDAAFIDGEIKVKGSIFLFQILNVFLRIFFNRNCRRLYKQIQKLGGH